MENERRSILTLSDIPNQTLAYRRQS
jgi:hypothetical protein